MAEGQAALAPPTQVEVLLAAIAKSGAILSMAEVERLLLVDAIGRFGVVDAGRLLQLGKTTVYRRMLQYEITAKHVEHRRLEPRAYEACVVNPLLVRARTTALHLADCVGVAHTLGEQLEAALVPFVGINVVLSDYAIRRLRLRRQV
ncbi:MAG TPA: hypothetical protein VJX23_03040 [Candidatus Binataceae bacterium]|nr:hypothetical protein [Candidatus Binataceae bacterium]